MQYAVQTIGLTKIFNDWWGRPKVRAVEDLDLRINQNEVFGLLGPNGSGKSTTLKLLLGLLYPTRGRAIVLGGDGADPKINRRIGYLPEESYLYRYLNPRETLDFYGRLFGLPARIRKERTETLLEMVGLKAVANRPIGTFSKGMARRIGLAQALINDPDLLILDEPTSGLDPIGTRQIKDLIRTLASRGKTVILCSHLLADVEDVCDRIAILYGGRIRAEGPVRQLLQQSDRMQITTGPISKQALDQIRQILAAEGGQVEVSAPMERLESFFMRIVSDAQARAQPTSGAVSTTQIGGFLVGQTGQELLERLVKTEPQPAQGQQQPVPAPTPSPVKRDVLDQLLDRPQKQQEEGQG